MGFFDDVPPPPPPPTPLPPPHQPWMGPPQGWVGGFVPLRIELGRGDGHVAMLEGITAFPEGLSVTMLTVTRLPQFGPMAESEAGHHRFGVAYSDGRKWQSGMPHALHFDPGPSDLVVHFLGGGGGGNHQRMELWLWPLPPEGPVTFAFEWEAAGIPETLTTVDGAVLRAAATHAEQLWEPLDPVEEAELHAKRFAARPGTFRTVQLHAVQSEPEDGEE